MGEVLISIVGDLSVQTTLNPKPSLPPTHLLFLLLTEIEATIMEAANVPRSQLKPDKDSFDLSFLHSTGECSAGSFCRR